MSLLLRLSMLLAVLLAPAVYADTAAGPAFDKYGDPLPTGAVARLGTAQHRSANSRVRFSPDGQSLLVLTWGKYLTVYDVKTGQQTSRKALPTAPANESQLFSDGKRALLSRTSPDGSGRSSWEVWDLEAGKLIVSINPETQWYQPPTISPDGTCLALCHTTYSNVQTQKTQVWDAKTGKKTDLDSVVLGNNGGYSGLPVVFVAGGKNLIVPSVTNASSKYRCVSVADGKTVWEADFDKPYWVPSVSPDGTLLMMLQDFGGGGVATTAEYIALDAATGKSKAITLPKGLKAYESLTFSPDGQYLIRVPMEYGKSTSLPLSIWDWKRGKPTELGKGIVANRGAEFPTIAVSPDSKTILLTDGGIRLFDLATGKSLWPDAAERGHIGAVSALVFSVDGRRLMSTGPDKSVRVWDVATATSVGRWAVRDASYSAEWSPDGGYNGSPVGTPVANMSPDGRRVVVLDPMDEKLPPTLRVVEIDSGRTVGTAAMPKVEVVNGQEPEFDRAGFSPAGDTVFVVFGSPVYDDQVTASSSLGSLNVASGKWQILGKVEPRRGKSAAMSTDARRWTNIGKIFAPATGQETFDLIGAGSGPTAFSPDGRLVAGIEGGKTVDWRRGGRQNPAPIAGVRVWDARTGHLAASLKWMPEKPSNAFLAGVMRKAMYLDKAAAPHPWQLALHPAGRLLVTADFFGVRVWDLLTGEVVRTLPLPARPPIEYIRGSPASAVAFSPDGTRLATGLPDGTILLWDVPRPPSQAPAATAISGLFADLNGSDAAKAWAAAWRLADAPADAVRLVRESVKPVEAPAEADVAKLIADLDAPAYRRREAATRRLEAMADRVLPAVVKALGSPISEEVQDRLRRVRGTVPDDAKPLPPWAATAGRVIALLEHAGTPDARKLLEELAAGAPGAWLTREAQESLARGWPSAKK